MNNKFDYDDNGKPVEKVWSARQLSNGDWVINGKVVDFEKLSASQKRGAEALQALHIASTDRTLTPEARHQLMKKYMNYKR